MGPDNTAASAWAWVKHRLLQFSTGAGAMLSYLAVNWQSLTQQYAPAALQQLAQQNPTAALAANIALGLIGFALMAWNERKDKGSSE